MPKVKEAPSFTQTIPVMVIIVFVLVFLVYPHTLAVVVGKILDVITSPFASK